MSRFLIENINFQSPLAFNFEIQRLPEVSFNIQKANVPGLSLGVAKMNTILNPVYFSGDNVTYDPFLISFKLDEGFKSWYSLFQWISLPGLPDNFEGFKDTREGTIKTLSNQPIPGLNTNRRHLGNFFSDVTLTILTSKENPYLQVVFKDAFPISLSELPFSSTPQEVNYLTCDCAFMYDTYSIQMP